VLVPRFLRLCLELSGPRFLLLLLLWRWRLQPRLLLWLLHLCLRARLPLQYERVLLLRLLLLCLQPLLRLRFLHLGLRPLLPLQYVRVLLLYLPQEGRAGAAEFFARGQVAPARIGGLVDWVEVERQRGRCCIELESCRVRMTNGAGWTVWLCEETVLARKDDGMAGIEN